MGRAPAKRAPVNDPKKTGVEGAKVEMTAPRPKGMSIMPPGTRSMLRLICSCNHASRPYSEYLSFYGGGGRGADSNPAAFIETQGIDVRRAATEETPRAGVQPIWTLVPPSFRYVPVVRMPAQGTMPAPSLTQ